MMMRNKSRIARSILSVWAVLVICLSVITIGNTRAFACVNCGCASAAHAMVRVIVSSAHEGTRNHIAREMARHRPSFVVDIFFNRFLRPDLRDMTNQLTANAMQQMVVLGGMIDASEQLETQRLIQKNRAEAHKDYQPESGLCSIGTSVRSLAASQAQGEFNTFTLSQRAMDREMRLKPMASGKSKVKDKESRIEQFTRRYCDHQDNNNTMRSLCDSDAPAQTVNRDVDYTRLIDLPLTLDIDLSNTSLDDKDEEDIWALASHLYADQTLEALPDDYFEKQGNESDILDIRSIMAKRSVAENSFNTLVGMKSKGSAGSVDTQTYMAAILKQLGIHNQEDINEILGSQPSYHAQMEVLTKKLYQRPEFYTDLYATPANVDRKAAALRAISLMQQMDMFKGRLRQEALLAVLLESELILVQEDLEGRMQ